MNKLRELVKRLREASICNPTMTLTFISISNDIESALNEIEAQPKPDYAGAIEVFREFLNTTDGEVMGSFQRWCRERLAAQNKEG